MAACESLLSAPFKKALTGGDSGVHETAIFIDPRMSSPGQPACSNGLEDPGELSLVIWFVEAVLDDAVRKQQHEEGRKARAEYEAVKRARAVSKLRSGHLRSWKEQMRERKSSANCGRAWPCGRIHSLRLFIWSRRK